MYSQQKINTPSTLETAKPATFVQNWVLRSPKAVSRFGFQFKIHIIAFSFGAARPEINRQH